MHVRILLFSLFLLFTGSFSAQGNPTDRDSGLESTYILLQDDQAGYSVSLPIAWEELRDLGSLNSIIPRVCEPFVENGHIPGATGLHGAVLSGRSTASPAVAIFALDYTSLGLTRNFIERMAETPEAITVPLSEALQKLYLERFPQSVMTANKPGEDYFSLNLRTVSDLTNEKETTRNRQLKVLLTADGAVMLMSIYDGPPDGKYETDIAFIMRGLRHLPEKSLKTLVPPYETSFFDYILVFGCVLIVFFVIRRLRSRQ